MPIAQGRIQPGDYTWQQHQQGGMLAAHQPAHHHVTIAAYKTECPLAHFEKAHTSGYMSPEPSAMQGISK